MDAALRPDTTEIGSRTTLPIDGFAEITFDSYGIGHRACRVADFDLGGQAHGVGVGGVHDQRTELEALATELKKSADYSWREPRQVERRR